jgi:hypothetical protein
MNEGNSEFRNKNAEIDKLHFCILAFYFSLFDLS